MHAYISKYMFCIYINIHIYSNVYAFMSMECLGSFPALFISPLHGLPPAGLVWGRFGILVPTCAQSSFLDLPGIS